MALVVTKIVKFVQIDFQIRFLNYEAFEVADEEYNIDKVGG